MSLISLVAIFNAALLDSPKEDENRLKEEEHLMYIVALSSGWSGVLPAQNLD